MNRCCFTVSYQFTDSLSQFSGINAFVYYAPTFFGSLGQSNEMSLILSGIVNICQLVAGIPIIFCLDRVGRRPLATIGGCAMAVPHLVIAGLMGKYSSDWASHEVAGWVCVALICRDPLFHMFSEHLLTKYKIPTFLDVYVLVYAASYGPLAWVLPREVFSSSQRAKGVGAAAAMIWLTNFIVGLVVPEMIKSIASGTFLFFGLFCVIAAIFSFFLAPEMSQESLEQIEGLFGNNSNFDEQELRNRVAREVWTDPWGIQSSSI